MIKENKNTTQAFKEIGFKVNQYKSMGDYIKANPKGKIAKEINKEIKRKIKNKIRGLK